MNVFSDLADFNNTVIRITFDPDEDEAEIESERSAPIAVVDDTVNEAVVQVFVVQLQLISSENPGSVDLLRQASVCKIIDDDSK